MTKKNDIPVTDMGLILDVVSKYFNVDKISIFKRDRKREICRIRQMFYHLCRKYNPSWIVSFSMIGSYYSDITGVGRGHCTVLYSCNKVSNDMDVYASTVKIEKELSALIEKEKSGEMDALEIMMSVL